MNKMTLLDVSLIKNLDPFVGMEDTALQDVLDLSDSMHYAKGKMIFREGDQAKCFYLLLDGHIRVVKTSPHGEQIIARVISSGELFGIAKALHRDTYPADTVAAVDCLVLCWSNRHWDKIVNAYPSFASNTNKTVGKRLAETQARVMELATERVEQRVASTIVKLAAQTGKKTNEGILIDFPISRQDVSEMTGTTLHTVSRLMSAWESKGWVKSGRQKITLLESHKLAMVAAGHDKN